MADMSPEAVTQRLRLMDELWELSVKLMNSGNKHASEGRNDSPPKSGLVTAQTELVVGVARVIGSLSPVNSISVAFEDDGETGYLYALDFGQESPMLDAMHIYNVDNVLDRDTPSVVEFQWSGDGLKLAFLINGHVHAVFDFAAERGYCRTGFPPNVDWSKEGHDWNEAALSFFE